MKLARNSNGKPLVGDDQGFVPLPSADTGLQSIDQALPIVADGNHLDLSSAVSTPIPANQISFGVPLENIRELWGIGLNYRDHAGDLDEDWPEMPGSFLKPTTAAIGPGGPIRLPPRNVTDRVTAEAEVGVVIGRECSNINQEQAEDVIAGYLPIIDMTAEDILQRNPRYLTRSKSFDSFIVIGPWITLTDEVNSLDDTAVRTIKNGEVVAENHVRNMQIGPHELVSFHSRGMTFKPGDIIYTGTPGATEIEPGDEVRAEVDGIGRVSASVVR